MSSFTSSETAHHLFLVFFTWFYLQISISSCYAQPQLINTCKEQCGFIPIPYPFYLSNSSCGFDGFKLDCSNSTLTLTLNSKEYVVLNVSSDNLLIDFSPARSCHARLDDFSFKGNQLYGISLDNALQLSECGNTSVCKDICYMPLCEGKSECCYRLSSHGVWEPGDDFLVFSAFGCKGFSSWYFDSYAKRGLHLEWGIPLLNSTGICEHKATKINARTVDGVRCRCETGFAGDGFKQGVGCVKSCRKHGRIAYGNECHSGNNVSILIAGVLASASFLAVLVMLHGLVGESLQKRCDTDSSNLLSTPAFQKNWSMRIFSYEELEQATNGFAEKGRLRNFANEMIYAGMIDDGIPVAVEKIHYRGKKELSFLLNKTNILSNLSRTNFVRLIGCATDLSKALLLVYEFFTNGTLEEHLQRKKSQGLHWHNRLNIAASIVKSLSYLKFEISPPIHHHNITSTNIFLEQDGTLRVALLCSDFSAIVEGNKDEVYNLGMILLEIITGSKLVTNPVMLSKKIDEGKLDEVIDPFLVFHQEQLHIDQVQRVVELGLRCVSVSSQARPSILQIDEELERIRHCSTKGDIRTSLEETFSNSSLLQMISISPDSSPVSSSILENGSSVNTPHGSSVT